MKTAVEKLPPRGEPTGGWQNYADCQAFHSSVCCRPDCRRCDSHSRAARLRFDEGLLAVIKFLADGRMLPNGAQFFVDHFDPRLNAHASDISLDRIAKQVEKFAAESQK